MYDLLQHLKTCSYPGRGIYIAKGRMMYFIMGRSQNSRNRIFVKTEDGIKTEAYDPSKLEDASLIIYHPVRIREDYCVVTNGDQTDTIVDEADIFKGSFLRTFEPDAPNYTPRISAFIKESGEVTISILKHAEDGSCIRNFFCYESLSDTEGLFISTYEGDGEPLPSFKGEPLHCGVYTPKEVWEALNPDNKVSLWAKVGEEVSIFNKNLGD